MGYYCMNYGTYDINWTMSYCILCLRLIGLAWDYRDSSLPIERLSEYQKSAAFKELPSLLEMLSFCFMPTACFAGPQVPLLFVLFSPLPFTEWFKFHSASRHSFILLNRDVLNAVDFFTVLFDREVNT